VTFSFLKTEIKKLVRASRFVLNYNFLVLVNAEKNLNTGIGAMYELKIIPHNWI